MSSRTNRRRTVNRKRVLIYAAVLAAGILMILLLGSGITAASAKQEKKEVYYTSVRVEAGDTLWSLAEKYVPEYEKVGDYVETLRQLNRIRREDRLIPGQILVIAYYK